jgi:hypothetical protein
MLVRAHVMSALCACALSVSWAGCGDDADPQTPNLRDAGEGGLGDSSLDGGYLIATGTGGGTAGFGGSSGFGGTSGFGGMTSFAGMGGFVPPGQPDAGAGCVFCSCQFACATSCVDCNNGDGCRCQGAAPLPWTPPFADVGAPGWKDSDEPFCTGIDGQYGVDVYSDARGVFAVVSGSGPSLKTTNPNPDEDAGVEVDTGGVFASGEQRLRTQLWFNDGNGWVRRMDKPDVGSRYRLSAVPSGPFLLNDPSDVFLGQGEPTPACRLGVVQGGKMTCYDLDPVQGVMAVDDKLVYALTGGVRLLNYDGEAWHSNSPVVPYPSTAIWADRDNVLAVGKAGTALWLQQGTWTADDPGTLESFTAVWGPARDDLWAGTSNGTIFHYDGAAWSEVAQMGGVSCDVNLPIQGIWGSGKDIYFYSYAEIAHWNGKKLESLTNWTCSATQSSAYIMGLSGTSRSNIFIAMIDAARFNVDECGAAFIVYYDGETFHRM